MEKAGSRKMWVISLKRDMRSRWSAHCRKWWELWPVTMQEVGWKMCKVRSWRWPSAACRLTDNPKLSLASMAGAGIQTSGTYFEDNLRLRDPGMVLCDWFCIQSNITTLPWSGKSIPALSRTSAEGTYPHPKVAIFSRNLASNPYYDTYNTQKCACTYCLLRIICLFVTGVVLMDFYQRS